MKLTKDEVKHIARLARIDVPPNKLDYYAGELSAVLQYVEKLNEVDTEGIEPKAHAADLASVFRQDLKSKVSDKKRQYLTKALIDAFPSLEKNFVKVKSVFSKED